MGVQNQELMNRLPLDGETDTWGSIKFGTYIKKEGDAVCPVLKEL